MSGDLASQGGTMRPLYVLPGGAGHDDSLEELIRRVNKLIADREQAPDLVTELKDDEVAMMAAYRACSPSYQRFLLHLARNEPSDAQLTGGDKGR
jgi:hypothetical protein